MERARSRAGNSHRRRATGRLSVSGKLFGSDNFVTGGTPMVLNMGGFGGRRPALRKLDAPQPELHE